MYIEKRFEKNNLLLCKEEIDMMFRLKHHSLTMYIAAFMVDKPTPTASVYIEFCDRGDLEGLQKAYARHPESIVPEGFIWHAFLGLTEALAYLQGGDLGTGSKPKVSSS